jgi:hypothetical protein
LSGKITFQAQSKQIRCHQTGVAHVGMRQLALAESVDRRDVELNLDNDPKSIVNVRRVARDLGRDVRAKQEGINLWK